MADGTDVRVDFEGLPYLTTVEDYEAELPVECQDRFTTRIIRPSKSRTDVPERLPRFVTLSLHGLLAADVAAYTS
jgi:hypothetical protein